MLNAHTQIEWRGELFHPLINKPDQLDWISTPLDLLTHPLNDSPSHVFGFETKFQQLGRNGLDLEFNTFVDRLNELGFDKFILLKRNNYLRQAISVARGRQTGQWHYSRDQPKPQFEPLTLDINAIKLCGQNRELLESFEYLDQTYEQAYDLLKAKHETLVLEYEVDLEHDPNLGFEKAIRFLELPNEKANASVRKLGGAAIPSMLTNYQAVQDRIAKTRYAWMLGDLAN